jgi:hypothetical protein
MRLGNNVEALADPATLPGKEGAKGLHVRDLIRHEVLPDMSIIPLIW